MSKLSRTSSFSDKDLDEVAKKARSLGDNNVASNTPDDDVNDKEEDARWNEAVEQVRASKGMPNTAKNPQNFSRDMQARQAYEKGSQEDSLESNPHL